MDFDNLEKIGLAELVDLSIGSPERGAINFNLIKSVLHIIIGQLMSEDEHISIEFRGSSADVIRTLKEKKSVHGRPLDMDVKKIKKSKPCEDEVKSPENVKESTRDLELKLSNMQCELDSLRLTQESMQLRYDDMTALVNKLINLIPNQAQVSPLFIEDKRYTDLVWNRHESGYRTEPSKSGKVSLGTWPFEKDEEEELSKEHGKDNLPHDDKQDLNERRKLEESIIRQSTSKDVRCLYERRPFTSMEAGDSSNQMLTHQNTLQHTLKDQTSRQSDIREETVQESASSIVHPTCFTGEKSEIQSREVKNVDVKGKETDKPGNAREKSNKRASTRAGLETKRGNVPSVRIKALDAGPDVPKIDKKQNMALIAAEIQNINLSSLYGRNRHCSLDDPAYLNSDMYDDKGSLKPMYDATCFRNAYDEALKTYSSSTSNPNSSSIGKDVKYDEHFAKEQAIEYEKLCTESRQKALPNTLIQIGEENMLYTSDSYHSDMKDLGKVIPTDVRQYLFEDADSLSGRGARGIVVEMSHPEKGHEPVGPPDLVNQISFDKKETVELITTGTQKAEVVNTLRGESIVETREMNKEKSTNVCTNQSELVKTARKSNAENNNETNKYPSKTGPPVSESQDGDPIDPNQSIRIDKSKQDKIAASKTPRKFSRTSGCLTFIPTQQELKKSKHNKEGEHDQVYPLEKHKQTLGIIETSKLESKNENTKFRSSASRDIDVHKRSEDLPMDVNEIKKERQKITYRIHSTLPDCNDSNHKQEQKSKEIASSRPYTSEQTKYLIHGSKRENEVTNASKELALNFNKTHSERKGHKEENGDIERRIQSERKAKTFDGVGSRYQSNLALNPKISRLKRDSQDSVQMLMDKASPMSQLVTTEDTRAATSAWETVDESNHLIGNETDYEKIVSKRPLGYVGSILKQEIPVNKYTDLKNSLQDVQGKLRVDRETEHQRIKPLKHHDLKQKKDITRLKENTMNNFERHTSSESTIKEIGNQKDIPFVNESNNKRILPKRPPGRHGVRPKKDIPDNGHTIFDKREQRLSKPNKLEIDIETEKHKSSHTSHHSRPVKSDTYNVAYHAQKDYPSSKFSAYYEQARKNEVFNEEQVMKHFRQTSNIEREIVRPLEYQGQRTGRDEIREHAQEEKYHDSQTSRNEQFHERIAMKTPQGRPPDRQGQKPTQTELTEKTLHEEGYVKVPKGNDRADQDMKITPTGRQGYRPKRSERQDREYSDNIQTFKQDKPVDQEWDMTKPRERPSNRPKRKPEQNNRTGNEYSEKVCVPESKPKELDFGSNTKWPVRSLNGRDPKREENGHIDQRPKIPERPPGRRGQRPKLITEETCKEQEDSNYSSFNDQPTNMRNICSFGKHTKSINVLHFNANYTDSDSSVAEVDSDVMLSVQIGSIGDFSSLFPKQKKYMELVRIVSDMQNYLTATGYDPFKKQTHDAFDMINRILADLVMSDETHEHRGDSNEGQHYAFLEMRERMEQMEKDIALLRDRAGGDESADRKRTKQATVTKEAYAVMRQLQDEVKVVQAKLAQQVDTINQNKLCSESLYHFIREMDHRKIDSKELDHIKADIIQRSKLDDKVDLEDFRSECQELQKAIETANKKLDVHRKFQILQSDIVNKIFEMLPEKIQKTEFDDLTDTKISEALKKLEVKLKKMIEQSDEGASGTRKPVLRDLRCISCNKDVVMRDKRDSYFVPSPPRYEDESRRSRLKNCKLMTRYCGGSHTKLGAAQKLKLSRRNPPLGDPSRVPPPRMADIIRKYTKRGRKLSEASLLSFPDIIVRR